MQWYTVYTKPHTEKKVSDLLSRKKIENYLPLNRIVENPDVSSKVINEPLFSCYVFVKANDKQLTQIKKIEGVVNLVYWLGKPVIINESEIEQIRRFTTDYVNLSVEKITLGNENVRHIDGLTADESRQIMPAMQKKVKATLSSLGYILSAEVETSKVRIISANSLVDQTKTGSLRLLSPVHSFYNFLKN